MRLGDCNLHYLVEDVVKEAAGYNPSGTSLRTGTTSPCTGEAYRLRAGRGSGRDISRPYGVHRKCCLELCTIIYKS